MPFSTASSSTATHSHATETLTGYDVACVPADFLGRLDDLVVERLVVERPADFIGSATASANDTGRQHHSGQTHQHDG